MTPPPIQYIINSVLNNENNFCCLCFESLESPITLDDEVALNITNLKTVKEICTEIFDDKVYSFISTFNSLCNQCVYWATSYYKFIHNSQRNTECLSAIINEISNNFDYIVESDDSKSLYVSLNLQDFKSKHYYDTETPATLNGALQRFRELDNPEVNRKLQKIKAENSNTTLNKNVYRSSVGVNIKDILCDKSDFIIKCKLCYKVYTTISNLKKHFIRVHAPKFYKCPQCPKKFASETYLESHKADHHCSVICSICGKKFTGKLSLRVHEMSHNITIVCHDCGRIYKNKTTFRKHKELNVCVQETRAHPSEAKFTCDYCNKKYTQKVSLRVHIQHEHGNYKSHICEWCGKKFWAPSRLKAHIVKHTKEKKFTCTICGGKFVTKESLLYHTRAHTGDNPYKCQFCDSRFPSASRRTDHEKRQHVGATLECDICYCKFKSRIFLQRHKKTHE